MGDLFNKYLDDQCSPDEVQQLMEYFKFPENQLMLRALIVESLENSIEEDDDIQWQPNADAVHAAVKKKIAAERVKLLPVYKKTWFRVAAAAIILSLGAGIYNLNKESGRTETEIVRSNTDSQKIIPGSYKATLTLADSSTIILETAKIGTLVEQGGANILKQGEGRLSYNLSTEKLTKTLFNTVTTPKGGQYQLSLSDGTIVWLNAASSLRFPSAFNGSERVVELTGEGYFEVAKDAAKPFKVNIGSKAEVMVLGTHFNINAYKEESIINATLLEGRIKVIASSSRDSLKLTPGQQVRINEKNEISIYKNIDTEQVVAWKNGIFNFNNEKLETVLRQVSRWYDVDIIFEGGKPQRTFNGEMQRTLQFAQILKILEKSKVRFKVDGRKLIILQEDEDLSKQ